MKIFRKKKNKCIVAIRIVSIVLFLAALLLLVFSIAAKKNPELNLFGYHFYRIADTGSMTPTLNYGDIVFAKVTAPEDLKVGDVISFVSTDPDIAGMVNTHRITDIQDNNGILLFTTAGDAHLDGDGNVIDDEYKVIPENIRGKVVYHSAFIGKIYNVLSNRTIAFCITILPLAVIVIISVFELAIAFYRPYDDDKDNKENNKND